MDNRPDWRKRGVIAAWVIGAATVGMALLAYLRPTDPAHPVRFDVLTTEISVPLWLAITVGVTISAITIITMRWFQAKPKRDKRYSPTSTEAKTPAESLNLVPSSSLVKPTAPVPESARDVTAKASSNERFRFDDSARMFSFTFAEGLAYEISSNHIGARGATVAVINNTPDYIGSYTVDVGEIASWMKFIRLSSRRIVSLASQSFLDRILNPFTKRTVSGLSESWRETATVTLRSLTTTAHRYRGRTMTKAPSKSGA